MQLRALPGDDLSQVFELPNVTIPHLIREGLFDLAWKAIRERSLAPSSAYVFCAEMLKACMLSPSPEAAAIVEAHLLLDSVRMELMSLPGQERVAILEFLSTAALPDLPRLAPSASSASALERRLMRQNLVPYERGGAGAGAGQQPAAAKTTASKLATILTRVANRAQVDQDLVALANAHARMRAGLCALLTQDFLFFAVEDVNKTNSASPSGWSCPRPWPSTSRPSCRSGRTRTLTWCSGG